MQKRGQFTILVVFALLALVAIGFVLFLRSQILESQTESQTNEKISDFIESSAVRNYVDSCLKAVGEQALIIGASQGGYFWDTQDAESDPNRIALRAQVDGQATEVTYVVQNLLESRQCGSAALLPPEYPYPSNGPYDLALFRNVCNYYQDRNAGFFGVRTMSPLCFVNGPNWDTAQPSDPSLFRICEQYGYHSNDKNRYAVQAQIMNYSSAKLSVCTDFAKLGDIQGTDITFDDPNVSITFGKENIIVNAAYPVKEKGKRETHYADFEYNLPVRYKELYEYLWDLALQEVQDLNFNAETSSSDFYKPGFGVQWFRCPGSNCISDDPDDDVLMVYDSNSIVDGKRLEIYGAIENRRPVLYNIPDNFGVSSIAEGDTVTYSIDAEDPDGDNLEYTLTFIGASGTSLISANIISSSVGYRFDNAGSFIVRITASDGEYEDYQDVRVDVS